jgi:hypothetical protein
MAIGCHEAQRVRTKDEKCAIEKIAGVFTSDGELGLRDHLPERFPRKHRAVSTSRIRKAGKILSRQRLHPRVEAICRNLDAVLVFLDPYVGLGQRLDDLEQLLRRQRERSPFGDRGRALAPKPDLQIRREQLDLVTRSFHEHVRQNRNRVLPLDDALEELQFAQQVGLPDDKLHVQVTSRDALRIGVLISSNFSREIVNKEL